MRGRPRHARKKVVATLRPLSLPRLHFTAYFRLLPALHFSCRVTFFIFQPCPAAEANSRDRTAARCSYAACLCHASFMHGGAAADIFRAFIYATPVPRT